MGGDVIYGIPRKPLRPRDQVVVYRAQVAHTRLNSPKKQEDPELPPPASPEELAGPVMPLPSGGQAGGERTPPLAPAAPAAPDRPPVAPRAPAEAPSPVVP